MLGGYIAEKRHGRTPCYKCKDRTAECHASCERYLAWAEAIRRDKAAHQHPSDYEADIVLIEKHRKSKEDRYKYKKKR